MYNNIYNGGKYIILYLFSAFKRYKMRHKTILKILIIFPILLAGCTNSKIAHLQKQKAEKEKKEISYKKQINENKQIIVQANKEYDKFLLAKNLKLNYQLQDYDSNLNENVDVSTDYNLIPHVRKQKYENYKLNESDQNKLLFFNQSKHHLSDQEKIELMDTMENYYKFLIKNTKVNSSMDNFGSYINKADLIVKNPYKSYSHQLNDLNALLKNIKMAKETLLYSINKENNQLLSDNSNIPFDQPKYSYTNLLAHYVKEDSIIKTLDFEKALTDVLNAETAYIKLQKENNKDIKQAKNRFTYSINTLNNKYENLQDSLKSQTDTIKNARNIEKINSEKEHKWQINHSN